MLFAIPWLPVSCTLSTQKKGFFFHRTQIGQGRQEDTEITLGENWDVWNGGKWPFETDFYCIMTWSTSDTIGMKLFIEEHFDLNILFNVITMKDGRSTSIFSLYGQLSQGQLSCLHSFKILWPMKPSYTSN